MPTRTLWPSAALLLAAATTAGAAPPLADAAFLGESARAMDTMMTGMAAAPSGDADSDFAVMMIPHHQGAIDMAVAELRHGHDEKLRRIAQEIIVDQQQEIVAMRMALDDRRPVARSIAQLAPATMAIPAGSHM